MSEVPMAESPKPERTGVVARGFDYMAGEWRRREQWRVPVISETGHLVGWFNEWRDADGR